MGGDNTAAEILVTTWGGVIRFFVQNVFRCVRSLVLKFVEDYILPCSNWLGSQVPFAVLGPHPDLNQGQSISLRLISGLILTFWN